MKKCCGMAVLIVGAATTVPVIAQPPDQPSPYVSREEHEKLKRDFEQLKAQMSQPPPATPQRCPATRDPGIP